MADDDATHRALVCLPGAMGAIDAGRAARARLASHRRLIQLRYPEQLTLAQFCEGVIAHLDALGCERADVLGSSFGGFVAQQLATRFPDRICDLVLVHSYVLDERGARQLALANRLTGLLPRVIFDWLVWLRVRGVLRPLRELQGAAYGAMESEVRRNIRTTLAPDALRRNNEWMIDGARHRGEPHRGRVLIIESNDDPLIRAPARAALRAAHPGARVITFEGTGHLTPLARPDAFVAAVLEFFESGDDRAVP